LLHIAVAHTLKIWAQDINKNIKRRTSHITCIVTYWNPAPGGSGSSLCMYAQRPVKSVHNQDDGGSARSQWYVAGGITASASPCEVHGKSLTGDKGKTRGTLWRRATPCGH